MKIFKFILLVFIPTSLFSQEVAIDFTKILFKDNFTSSKDELWTQTYNIDNLFVKQANSFDLIRKNGQLGYFVTPNYNEKHSAFEVKSGFTLIKYNRKKSSAGLLVMADKEKSAGILIELNQKREYRICRVYPDRIAPITKGKDGWVKNSFAVLKGYNEILVRCNNKVYDLYINQKYVSSFSEIELSKGSVGLYIGPSSHASFKFIELLGVEENEQKPQFDSETNQEDLALAQVIIKLRNDLTAKDLIIEDLKAKLKNCNTATPSTNQTFMPDTALINRNKEMSMKIREINNENNILKADLLRTKAELNRLLRFKEEVEGRESGDIVINLTNVITAQKEKISELEDKINQLDENNNQIKSDNMVLTNHITKRDENITNLENRINELDSLNKKYKEIIDNFEKESKNPNYPISEKDNNNQNQENNNITEPDIIDQDYINKLINKEKEDKRKKQ